MLKCPKKTESKKIYSKNYVNDEKYSFGKSYTTSFVFVTIDVSKFWQSPAAMIATLSHKPSL